ncbi:MAG: putative porin [Bacteroidales bacterium]|nr:putative porin [Bacteroidales bacterium]
MRKYNYLKIAPLLFTLLLFQRLLFAGMNSYQQIDTLNISDTVKKVVVNPDFKKTLVIDSLSLKKISKKNILDILNGVDSTHKIVSWRLNPKSFDLEVTEGVDTSLFFPHLIIPTQKRLETITSLGNMGAPLQTDHFFNRNRDYKFIFSRYHSDYSSDIDELNQFHVKKPLSLVNYSMGGGNREAEQTMHVLHTQNVNKYLNAGFVYDYFGTKGMYKDQLTKNNLFSFFASYYRDRFSFQSNFSYARIRNQENGGLVNDAEIQDASIEAALIKFKLHGTSSEEKQKGFSGIVGYNIINRWVKGKDSKGNQILIKKPVFSLKAMFVANKSTRTYVDTSSSWNGSYYKNFYIGQGATHDSSMLVTYESTILGEIDQLAKFPGLPGLRFWITNTRGKYYYFQPNDFVFKRSDNRIESNNFGLGVFSYSPYLSYTGSLRMYIDGYRAADKELLGQMMISPWKSSEYPYIKAKIEISDKEPDIFLKNYYSNHYKWDNDFVKEKWFLVGGSIGADKWRFEAGYNLARINNYVYFDTTGVPKQTSGVTVTSAFVQKDFKLGGLHFTNRIVWQANTNKEILNLPTFSVFSSLFFEYELVKKVLLGRIGANVFYRSKFFVDAYSPATGQFHNQKEKQIGEYPIVDVFVDFKWKRAVLFFKGDHVNGMSGSGDSFSTIHYPLNRFIFKIGVSWIFYD